jgi:PmbA protein
MEQDLLKQAQQAVDLAKQSGAADAIANVSDNNSTEYTYRDSHIEEVKQSVSRGLSLQIYVDGRYSTHQTTDLRPETLSQFVTDAVALTKHLSQDPYRVIPETVLYNNRPAIDLQNNDPTVRDLPREICLDWLKTMDAVTHTHERVISASSYVWYGWNTSARISSNGFSGTQSGTSIGYGVSVTLKEGEHGRPEASRIVRSRHLSDLPSPDQIAQEGLDRVLSRLGSTKANSIKSTLVIDPEAGGRIFGSILSALQAHTVQQNRSFLADKNNTQIANPLLTLTDDPLKIRGLASRHYDSEGISAKQLPIIEKGVLKNFYVDTYYGRKLNWSPTTGRSSNITFALGNQNLTQLIADVAQGFYITSWLGGNADSTTGDFSFGFRGHQISNGQLTMPVSEMNVTGNFITLLNNLVAVGNDPNPYSSMQTPTLVFENVEFSGK